MEHLSIAQCRQLIGQPQEKGLSDEAVERLRDMLYALADVVSDAFVDLGNIDQNTFNPPGDALDVCQELTAETIGRMGAEGVDL
jgi:hypothetical protein